MPTRPPLAPALACAPASVFVALRIAAERGYVLFISTRICLAVLTTVVQRAYAWHVKQTTGEHFLAPYAHSSRSAVWGATTDSASGATTANHSASDLAQLMSASTYFEAMAQNGREERRRA